MSGVLIGGLIRHTVAALSGAPQGGQRITGLEPYGHLAQGTYFGHGTIAGQATEVNLPTSCKVYLLDRRNGYLVRSTVSAADGSYRFDNIAMDVRYAVMAFDNEKEFNAVIADNLTPALMP